MVAYLPHPPYFNCSWATQTRDIEHLQWNNVSMILTHRENTNLGNSYNSPHSSSWVIDCITMTTSSNGNIFRVTGPLCGEFTGPGEFPAQKPVTRGFDVFFDLRPNKWLSKQSWGWWFETLSWSLWRQCNALCETILWSRGHMVSPGRYQLVIDQENSLHRIIVASWGHDGIILLGLFKTFNSFPWRVHIHWTELSQIMPLPHQSGVACFYCIWMGIFVCKG